MSKLMLFDLDYTLFDTALFKESGLIKYSLYEGVYDLLAKYAKDFELGILSQGEENFQLEKLKRTNTLRFFDKDKIHIVPDKPSSLKTIIETYKDYEIWLVDDKIDNLILAKKLKPGLKTVWIKNGPYALKAKDERADFIYTSVREML